MSPHTPGPWHAVEQAANPFPRLSIYNPSGTVCVASIKPVQKEQAPGHLTQGGVMRANATLIAEAPALLEGSKALLAILGGMLDEVASRKLRFGKTPEEREERERIITGFLMEYADQLDKAADTLNATVARAEGKS
jgi:hypothetical protein